MPQLHIQYVLFEQNDGAQDGQDHAQKQWEIARAHAGTGTNRITCCAVRKCCTDNGEHQAGEKVFLTLD